MRFITFIKRFFYYGYHGAKYTQDYDAECVHNLVYAHMKRVSDFMHNPKLTHLVWNSNSNNKDMRRLREFVELSKRINGPVSYYCREFIKNHPKKLLLKFTEEQRKEFSRAVKKDTRIRKQLEDRYWYMFRYIVPRFWD